MKKRILSMLLVLVLMATLVPVSASAAVTIYWPVPGHTRLSQGYHANNAIDISDGSINGATVIAAASGTVTHIYLCSNTHNDSYSIQHPESTDCNGFGTGLVIKADDGRIYQYAHMQGGSIPSNVYHGAYVTAGQTIGRVGATGCATGPHLHFGISTTPNKYWEYGPNPDPAAGNYNYIYDGSCLQHTYGDWTYTKYPTCTETGTQVRSCTKCGHTETRSIAPTLHSYGDWVVTKSATCTEDGVETRTCPKCNGVETRSIPKSGHTYGDWTVVQEASCTAQGSKTRTCSTCGNVDTAVIEMAAHKYVSETIPATCSAPGGTKYICSVCGKTYTETATVGWSDWSETKPAGVEDSLIESKTQYRSSKYETKTSYNTSESGWTRKSSDWEKANSGSVTYVKSWPGGFHTGNALYGTYNKTPVSASETATAKTVVNSEAVSGYIYWHWCRGSYTAGPINRRVSDVCEGEFQTFHAFFSTSNAPSTDENRTNGGDCKYYPNDGCCKDTYWYFQIPVYTQSYTNYKKLFTYERWTDWSDWGDKEISASDTRKVETRTVYRYYTAAKEHTWDAGTVTAAATCTADGAKTYTCSVCQTTKTEPIAKLGHDYRQTVVAATCTAKGYTLNKCSRCGDEYRDAETAMLPHKYVDGVCTACGDKVTMFTLGAVTAKAGDTVTVPVEIKNNTGFAGFTLKITADANLTLTGIAKGELMEKANSGLFVDNVKGGVINWTSDRNITGDGVLLELTFTVADNAPDGKYEISVALKDDEASNCVDENGRALRAAFEAGSVLVSAAPHMHDYAVTVTAPTCTAKGYTTHTCACGDSYVDTYVDALGHAWDNGKVTKEPTETETGVKTFTCTRCGETRTETMPVIPHVHSYKDVVTAPTCTEKGYTTHTCACGDSYVDTYVDALGHAWDNGKVTKEPTETETGVKTFTCTRCGETRTETMPVIPHVHSYKDVVTAPTCTEKGYTTHTCACGDSYVDTYVDALGHAWDNGKVTKEPTETETGVKTFTCTRCGETRTETMPVIPHVHSYKDVVTAPTCTEKGYTTHTCACGDSYVDTYVDALGHAWDNGKVTKEPTETETGVKTFTCTRCGETRTETMPVIPHVHSYKDVVTAPTCTEKGYTTHTCACGDSYVDTYVDALGHAWDNGKVTKEPTETETGVKTFTCTRCGETKTETIPATGSVDVTEMFTDVSHSWADDGIQYCVTHQLMSGIGNDLFGPKLTTTRAQIVQILYNLEGEPKVSGTTPFTDLTQDWYQDAVLWAYQTGVVAGTSSTTFEPDRPVTREQIAVILMEYVTRVLKLERTWTPADLSIFPDADSVSDWAKEAMADAVALGLISGASNGGQTLLEPQGSATREQVATILMEFCKNVKK